MDVYSYLTNEWHNCEKDQVVIHAISDLIGMEYNPVLKGVTAFEISFKACSIFQKFGINKCPTNDIGTCSMLTQELVRHLIVSGIITDPQIRAQTQEVWTRLYHTYLAGTP